MVYTKRKVSKLLPAFSTTLGAVYNVDCVKLLATIRPESVSTVFADPPFNLSKDYGNGKDKDDLKNGDYLKWCYRWIDECVRVLKPGGPCSWFPVTGSGIF
jgi:site-specific DNA-methyltransferase (adenine-specific)